MVKAKAKAERAAALAQTTEAHTPAADVQSAASSRAHTPTPTGGPAASVDDDMTGLPVPPPPDHLSIPPPNGSSTKDTHAERTELLRLHPAEITRFINLIVPLLVDVYAASVSVPVRTKSLASLLKATAFQDEDQLRTTLQACFSYLSNQCFI